jgi:hypothetical protein
VNKRELLPPQIIFTPRKEKEKKKKKKREKKEKYSFHIRRTDWAVKVFWQNTTRSATRCGDCGKNP